MKVLAKWHWEGNIGSLVVEGRANVDELLKYLMKALPPNEASGMHFPEGLSVLCWGTRNPVADTSAMKTAFSQLPGSASSLLCEIRHSTDPFSGDPFQNLLSGVENWLCFLRLCCQIWEQTNAQLLASRLQPGNCDKHADVCWLDC